MTNQLLRIDASMRKSGSYRRKLGDRLIEQLQTQQPHGLTERDLADGVPHINEAWINANFTDISERSTQQRSVLSYSDVLVSELESADVVVIGLPIYNFGVPAAFKAWIDQIVRAKRTFRYGKNGPEGLLENTKAYIILSSGGTQLGSDIDFVSGYIRHVLGFIGIDDLTFIDSSGIGRDEEKVLTNAISPLMVLEPLLSE